MRPYKAFFNRQKQGMDRKSDKALRDGDSRGKKESLSKSIGGSHTLVRTPIPLICTLLMVLEY